MIKTEKIESVVLSILKELAEEQSIEMLKMPTSDTRLFGKTLDSMGVVLLVTELENVIYDEFEKTISLADERAMSQRTSPFRSVQTLVDYVTMLINEA
ncbi:hypothetical protein [Vibrio fluvialis]|uniref:hypothetical protein n=1 Tax=Vibrio fluvialis TaxID=676 RepID=UPI001EEB6FA2|nr:hypothetical protein [Vibrio fluvialis]MCG6349096.1 hypothetical protein [Vibrio fluvialis]